MNPDILKGGWRRPPPAPSLVSAFSLFLPSGSCATAEPPCEAANCRPDGTIVTLASDRFALFKWFAVPLGVPTDKK